MVNAASVTLFGLALTANALPQSLDLSKACTHNFNSEDGAKTAWLESGAEFILNRLQSDESGRKNWVVTSDAFVRGSNDGTTLMDCGSIDGVCLPLTDCDYYKDKNLGSYYYLFRAVQGAHSFANYIREGLQDSTLEASLSIAKMVEFWKPKDSADKTMFAFISAAFSMASGAAAADPRVSAMFGFASGVTAAAAEANDKESDDWRGSLEDVVLRMFSASRDAIKNSLQAAMVAENAEDIAKLPEGTIAGFFGDGRYLFNSVSSVGEPVIQNIYKRMRQALMGVTLKQTDHWVLLDDSIMSSRDCKYPGAWWSDATSACYYLIEKVSTPAISCSRGDASACDWKPLTREQKENIESYGVDLGELYKNACQCAFNSKNGQKAPDVHNTPTDGSMAQCFYPLECKMGTPWDFSWDHSEMIGWEEITESKVPK